MDKVAIEILCWSVRVFCCTSSYSTLAGSDCVPSVAVPSPENVLGPVLTMSEPLLHTVCMLHICSHHLLTYYTLTHYTHYTHYTLTHYTLTHYTH